MLKNLRFRKNDFNVWEFVPESNEGSFLILTASRADDLKFAHGIVNNRTELAERYKLESEFILIKTTFADRLAYVLNWPIITVLLLGIGIVALLFELSAPGISVGGILSAFCFGMFFWAKFFGGTAGGLELIMFAMGVVFLLLELFVIPGFGIPGLLGLFLIASSLVLASQDFVIPSTKQQVSIFTSSLISLVAVGAISVLGGFFIFRFMGSIPILSSLVLEPPVDELASNPKPKAEPNTPAHFPAVGHWGEVESALRPSGKAKFSGKTFDVVADGFIEAGTPVKVVAISGKVIHVSSDPAAQK